MKLVVISSEGHFEKETLWLQRMFEAGLSRFHLRKPSWTLTEINDFLKQIDAQYHPRIVLHDHYELHASFALGGAHFNSRNNDNWNVFSSNYKSKSASLHTFDEIVRKGSDFNYVFLSPIFDSISKKGYRAAFDQQELKTFLHQKLKTEVYALGGVTIDTIAKCKRMGFDGIAVLGVIWQDANPLQVFTTLQKECQENVPTY